MDSLGTNDGETERGWGWAALLLLACLGAVPATISQVSADHSAADRREAPPRSAYAGDAACAQCHRKESEFYKLTPHARDSGPATAKNITGSFSQGHNVLHTSNPNLVVNMVARPDGFYQSAVNLANPENRLEERFDIVIGSGRHGQSYLYWQDDLLFEMPTSYWTWNHEWVISPGFPAGQVHFDRAIVPRCLECHGSYFTSLAPPLNRFEKNSLMLGINCERCHGPGARHVAYERSASPRSEKHNETIVNPTRLTRDRQLDLCALCHAGAVEPTRPPLTFVAGDDVHDYLAIQPPTPDAPPDVHGNQVGALEQSKCFTSSKMTCSTCHNVHEKQENAEAFSRHCLSCHAISACGKYVTLGSRIRTKCVDCHMPLLESGKITSDSSAGTLHAMLRAHQIKVYREASEAVERDLKGK
ncbi:MAG: multiheme c-type cytochrome [Terracidiphilus sp.]